jgi:hypothetical protein
MAVAAAPCEERDGLKEDWRAAPLSVLPVLLAAAAFGSPGLVHETRTKSAPDLTNQLAGPDV